MKRTKKKADAILVADIHLRDTAPVCRIDDYWETQVRKIKFINELKEENNGCIILAAGDIFHKAKSTPFLESWAIFNLSTQIYAIPGQHDLPSHNIGNLDKSSFGVLLAALILRLDPWHSWMNLYCTASNGKRLNIVGFPFGEDLSKSDPILNKERINIALVHTMVHKDKPIHKDIKSTKAVNLLKQLKFDLIVSGDNHQPFVQEYEGRLLVNPGSMMRMTADQIDHKPRVYLWYADSNTVEPIYLPIEEEVIDRRHLETKEQRDNRIEAFVSRMGKDYEVGLSFRDNLNAYFEKNKTRKPVQNLIWEAIDG